MKLSTDEMRGMLVTDANLNSTMMGREGLVPASCPGKIDTRNIVYMELGQITVQDTTEVGKWEEEPLFCKYQGDEHIAEMESKEEYAYWQAQEAYERDRMNEYGLEVVDNTTKECWGCNKTGHIKSQFLLWRDKGTAPAFRGNHQ